MQQMSGFDATFLYAEAPKRPLHIGPLLVYDQSEVTGGALRYKQILDYANQRLHLSPIFRRKLLRVPLDITPPYWIDDPDFDIEFHIRHIALPQPRDWRQLCIEASRLWARPLDLTRPPWEWWIIEGLDNVEGVPAGSFAILQKMHHSAVDGVAGITFIDAAHTATPDEVPAAPEWSPAPRPSQLGMLQQTVSYFIGQPRRMVKTLGDFGKLGQGTLMRGLRSTPLKPGGIPKTRFGGAVGSHRVHDSMPTALKDFKAVRKAVPGSTVNDCIVAIVGAAMRDYLTRHDELPDSSLVAGVPISIRPEAQASHGGNAVVMANVTMATDIDDPLEQLRAITEVTKAKKEFTHAVPANALTDVTEYLPGALLTMASRLSAQRILNGSLICNTVITNLPGPQQPVYLAGARLAIFDPFAPVNDGLGLMHAIVSYTGVMRIGFTADRDMLPDPDVYLECLEQARIRLLTAG
jgi:diacylglycerol O-acyltransferase / wax synthase